MGKVKFYSYKPYLQIPIRCRGNNLITFNKNCEYITRDKKEIELLRIYAEKTKHSYTMVEVNKGINSKELARLNAELLEEEIVASQKRIAQKIKDAEAENEENELIKDLKAMY